MFKITYLVLCAVAINLSGIYAATSPEVMEKIITECAKENGVTENNLRAAWEAEDVKAIDKCFWGCALKKTGFMNEKGEYDVDNGMVFIEKNAPEVKGREEYTMMKEMAKQCESVNEEAVSDEEAGCERAALVAACVMEQLKVQRKKVLK